jgi:glyoxalase family protein
MNLEGIHHVAAITAQRGDCIDFYSLLLGLDRIDRRGHKRQALTFGNRSGNPGSVLSFSDVPGAPAGVSGSGLVHRLQWRVKAETALAFWQRRLELAGVRVEAIGAAAGGPAGLRFSDPEGLGHELLIDDSDDAALIPARTLIPWEFRLRGLAGVRAHVRGSVESSDLLAGRLGFEALAGGEWRVRGQRRQARYGCDPPPPSRPLQGAGTVTHVAWSCRPGQERAWRQRVIGMGATVSPVIDADRFRCFFFREPDGVLFSIATQDPGRQAGRRQFNPPQPAELPRRISRPIGLVTAV